MRPAADSDPAPTVGASRDVASAAAEWAGQAHASSPGMLSARLSLRRGVGAPGARRRSAARDGARNAHRHTDQRRLVSIGAPRFTQPIDAAA
jgi:hypothetical protein